MRHPNRQSSFLELYQSLHSNAGQRGKQFEYICKWFLQNDPEYRRQLRRVWLWEEWPGRWGRDKGIDLIGEDFDGGFWAVQAKAYASEHSITKQDVDKFLSESSRKIIAYRLLIATAGELGHNAKEAIEGQEKPVGYLLLADLKKRRLNWPPSPAKLVAHQAGPRTPRSDQRKAIADIVNGFRKHDRGQLIRACGTGKTLIGLRIAEALKAQRTLVLVPSLSLISQIVRDWTVDGQRPFRFMPVCSDDTVRGQDHLVNHTGELGVPATTDPALVAEFLHGTGTRVVFSTYQSTPILVSAFERHRIPPFDLAIADEAHRCAGFQAGPFATILDSRRIHARKRLFMTATPRYFAEATREKADEMGMEVASMDDHDAFGPVFHKLMFSEAIRRKLLTDYTVVIIGVDDPMYRQYAKEGVFVTLDGKRITDARTLASHIAVAKAIKQYDLRRIITFHGRVSRAREFSREFPDFMRWMPKAAIPSGNLWADLISGEMASSRRDAILDRLRDVQAPERGLVSNARCLGEGVDVRALDGVAFIDPKESPVDIIQAVGRAIRKAERKKLGVIILPVYISSDEEEGKVLEDSAFKQVWRVLRALRAHDDRLADELDNISTKIGRGRRVRALLPKKIVLEQPDRLDKSFVNAFYLRTVRSITPVPRLTIEQILKWADSHHAKTGEWPYRGTGRVLGAPGETWLNIDWALRQGNRGLLVRSSLARLLADKRGVRNRMSLPPLTEKDILHWADLHHKRTGKWPNLKSGAVLGVVPGEEWFAISMALRVGARGLPGGSSLARLLAKHRGVQNIADLPKLTLKQILQWADMHHTETGKWPNVDSGKVPSRTLQVIAID
jgi:predicted helicase